MSSNKQQGGVGCSTVVLIILVVLKLAGLITWSWVWVLAPLWIPALIIGALFVLALKL